MGIGSMGNMPSQKHTFSQVPRAEIQRSSFDRSHGHKTTFNAGYLIPHYVDEALPGDTFHLECSTFARLSTPIKPLMDNLYIDQFYFAVPIRLVWDNFQKFMGEQRNPGDSTSYLVPQITWPANPIQGPAPGTLADYMGIPGQGQLTPNNAFSHNSLHMRAYNLIWNEWFRDQNLQNSAVVDTDDGPDSYTDYFLRTRGKRHDYFTSALPWPQKGTAVTIPLGTSASIRTTATAGQAFPINQGAAGSANNYLFMDASTSNLQAGASAAGFESRAMFADLTNATSATINSLRQAFQIQRLMERDARGGTRYTEIIRSHFGVTSPDARLQRPEYLGGGSAPINFYPVAQTQETTGTTPQGNLAATAISSSSGQGFTKSFTEHTLIIGLVSVRADLNYQQGLNRMWSRQTKYDFYWPALAHIGEQVVYNKEIYATGTSTDNEAFGYQERYAEYRYKPNMITGLFRSTATGTLDIWHVAQEFGALPSLNETFILENPPIDRVVAVPSEPQILFDSWMKLLCARPMPTYSVPGMIDHF